MPGELIILIAAFLFFLGWFLEALLKEERLFVSSYVYLVDGKWRTLPAKVIEISSRIFDRVFGDSRSFRCISIVFCYSLFFNLIIMSKTTHYLVFGYANTFLVGNDPGRDTTFIGNLILFFVCIFGFVHDYISLIVTRFLISIRYNVNIKILFDAFFALIIFSSTLLFSISIYHICIGMIIDGVYVADKFSLFIDNVHSQFRHYFHFLIRIAQAPYDAVDTTWIGPDGYAFWYAAITSIFPTLCYVVLLALSLAIKTFLAVAHRITSAFLDWLSKLPPHQIGLVTTGLSALIVLLQAWVALMD